MKPTIRPLALLAALVATLGLHGQAEEKPIVPTELVCEHLRMENDGVTAYFVATKNVVLTGTNLEIICDKLEINVSREGTDPKAAIGEFGTIESMVATGNVKITQAERIATAGLVIVEPAKEQIIMREDPLVQQNGTTLSGLEITIKRGQGDVIVTGDKDSKVRFSGPSIKDLGFETDKDIKKAKPQTKEESGDEDAAKANDEKAETEGASVEAPQGDADATLESDQDGEDNSREKEEEPKKEDDAPQDSKPKRKKAK